jgi:hypothetical protein
MYAERVYVFPQTRLKGMLLIAMFVPVPADERAKAFVLDAPPLLRIVVLASRDQYVDASLMSESGTRFFVITDDADSLVSDKLVVHIHEVRPSLIGVKIAAVCPLITSALPPITTGMFAMLALKTVYVGEKPPNPSQAGRKKLSPYVVGDTDTFRSAGVI